ncbi:MAG: 4-(cytidine 5'-diphospho)-2-C-methyl-D-erythritol kinase [Lachnospiraceae bacterium]|nr:4-(cytidine 5'-diphospho)-2-C-methyl-D-erythritol kinase [Lachnospiraceae bacterium]
MTASRILTETAYAKINLALDITGRLPNGYHTVRMIMETISIHDDLTIALSSGPGIGLSCDMVSDTLAVSELSCGDDNLIVKAAHKLLEYANARGKVPGAPDSAGLDMHLTKRIPMAAGLAGGSADAAAALRGINRLLDLGCSVEELCEIGVTIGADVPYCIQGGSRLAEGIGEQLSILTAPPKAHLLIAKPDIDVSTAYVYKRIDSSDDIRHPDIDGMIAALDRGDLKGLSSRLGNVLRDVTCEEHAIVPELEQFMRDNGALGALMSGSGPTVYGIFDDEQSCRQALEKVHAAYPDIYASDATFIIP